MGLDPRTPGSCPELKADNQPTKPPRRPPQFIFIFIFFKDFIYLFNRDRDSQQEREHKQGEWERKKQAEEPDVGLDPITPGSRPEPKADA